MQIIASQYPWTIFDTHNNEVVKRYASEADARLYADQASDLYAGQGNRAYPRYEVRKTENFKV